MTFGNLPSHTICQLVLLFLEMNFLSRFPLNILIVGILDVNTGMGNGFLLITCQCIHYEKNDGDLKAERYQCFKLLLVVLMRAYFKCTEF